MKLDSIGNMTQNNMRVLQHSGLKLNEDQIANFAGDNIMIDVPLRKWTDFILAIEP